MTRSMSKIGTREKQETEGQNIFLDLFCASSPENAK